MCLNNYLEKYVSKTPHACCTHIRVHKQMCKMYLQAPIVNCFTLHVVDWIIGN